MRGGARELVVRFGGQVDKSLPAAARRAAGQIGEVETKVSRSNKVLGGLKSAGAGAMKVVGGAVLGLGGAAAAAGAVAAKAGWDRLTAIDNARAKLKGLGHDTESVEKIMGNAMASVKGTAFGMGGAASLAGQIVAAGIKPGKELERVLSLVGDTATIAGTDLGEMGNVFSKIAGVGKLTGESMAQLSERGIPVLQWLSKEYGVSAEAAQKMVSQGKVDFKSFSKIVEKNIGGAAKAGGDTMEGAMANARAAVGRLGASFLEPIFGKGPAMFKGITEQIDKLSPAAKKAGEWVDTAATKVGEFLAKIDFKGAAEAVGSTLTKIRDGFLEAGAAGSGVLSTLKGYVDTVVDGFKTNVLPALQEVGGAAAGLARVVGPIIAQITARVKAFLTEWGPTIRSYVTQITQIVGEGLQIVVIRVHQVTSVIKAIWDRWGQGILTTLTAVGGNLVKAIGGALNVIQGVVRLALSVLRGDWSGAWAAIKQIVGGATTVVKNLISGTMRIITDVTRAGTQLVIQGWNWMRDRAVGAVTGLRDRATKTAGQTKDWVLGKFSALKTSTVELFKGIAAAVSKPFSGIQGAIASPLRTATTWLNKNILSPMNGVTSKFGVKIPQLPKFHKGGMIPGRDELPIMALGGEGMLTRDAVRRIGGKKGLDALNRGRGHVGGLLDDLKEAGRKTLGLIKKPVEWAASVAKQGAGWALGQLFDLASQGLTVPPPMAGDLLRGTLMSMKTAATSWGKRKDQAEAQKAQAVAVGAMPTGKGAAIGAGRAWPANTRALSGNYSGHSGVDIAAAMGTPIFAAASGPITYAGWGRGYGQAIFQSIGGGLQAVYGHSSRVGVTAGQNVGAGQVIGAVGSTGRSSGPHLHFEVNAAGGFGSVANRAATLRWLGFDSGGWLPPGVTPTVNNTGKPEAILTADQWERLLGALQALAEAGPAVIDGQSLARALRDETRRVATMRRTGAEVLP